jgi:hypothetical protein
MEQLPVGATNQPYNPSLTASGRSGRISRIEGGSIPRSANLDRISNPSSTKFRADTNIVFLMFHRLEVAEHQLHSSDPGYLRYILTQETFGSQMQWIKGSGFRGFSISEALRFPQEPSVSNHV